MEFFFKVINGQVVPDSQYDADEFHELKPNTLYKAKVTQPRNYKFHRKYMALIKLAYEHQEEVQGFDNFRKRIQIMAGHYDGPIIVEGKPIYYPRSISFGSMDQIEFEKLYGEVLDVVLKEFVHMNAEDVDNIINQLVGFV